MRKSLAASQVEFTKCGNGRVGTVLKFELKKVHYLEGKVHLLPLYIHVKHQFCIQALGFSSVSN